MTKLEYVEVTVSVTVSVQKVAKDVRFSTLGFSLRLVFFNVGMCWFWRIAVIPVLSFRRNIIKVSSQLNLHIKRH